jgi:hypothetical protein
MLYGGVGGQQQRGRVAGEIDEAEHAQRDEQEDDNTLEQAAQDETGHGAVSGVRPGLAA